MAESRLGNLDETLHYVSLRWSYTLWKVCWLSSEPLLICHTQQTIFHLAWLYSILYPETRSWTISSYISVMSVSSSFSTHTPMLTFPHTTGSQRVGPRPATPAWPRNLLEMQIFRFHLRPPKSNLGGENHCATYSPWPTSSLSSTVTGFFIPNTSKTFYFRPLFRVPNLYIYYW